MRGIMAKKKPTIFVQIAAYRDPELRNTIEDLLVKASNPKQLHIAIGWQRSPYEAWDHLDEYQSDKRFTIIDVDYRDARGPCWIRAQLNAAYTNQTYTLQLDSHHRVIEGWDTILIDMLENIRSAEHPKPLLSSYLPSYNPANDPAGRVMSPWIMEFDRFAPEGPVHFLPHTIDDFMERDAPVPTRFISGHFIFADGTFCKEVPYDPTYYFHGEEINLSVRAYMAGYDLFAPHKVFMWHEYTREGKKKHWDDHSNWSELDKVSHAHNRDILGIDNPASDKLLTTYVRTLREYELYAGLEFSTRRAHQLTLEKKRPPVSLDDISHTSGLAYYQKICVDIHKTVFTENDYTFWAIAFEDAEGKEIHRRDADAAEIQQILSTPYEKDKFVHIWRNFYTDKQAVKWIVWPHSASKGWMERLTGNIGR
jgi:hypothetical protein